MAQIGKILPNGKQGRVSCVYPNLSNGSGNVRCQAITWTTNGVLSTRYLGNSLSDISNEIQNVSFKKLCLKMVAILSRPQGVKSWMLENHMRESLSKAKLAHFTHGNNCISTHGS